MWWCKRGGRFFSANGAGKMSNGEHQWLEWLAQTMPIRPRGNIYLDSERGMEIGKLCLEIAREQFSWRRADPDTFWVDVQFYTKYKLDDNEIRFVEKMQAGLDNHKANAPEKNAYAEMMRGIEKLKAIEFCDDNSN